MKRALIFLVVLFSVSCKKDFSEDKYNVELSITNKTTNVIPGINVNGANGARIWTFQNVAPGKTEKIIFNVKEDFETPEGGLVLTAFFNEKDSLSLNTGYFTNWQYQGPNPPNFNIYEDKIEEVK